MQVLKLESMRVVSPEQMRQMDRQIPSEWAMPSLLLMENAAQAACELIRRRLPGPWESILILCGPGNNGGDGLALARLLSSNGFPVQLCCLFDVKQLKGNSLTQWEILEKLQIPCLTPAEVLALLKSLHRDFKTSHIPHSPEYLLVDALLGTGLNRPPSQDFKELIVAINQSGQSVISLDIPSGVDGLTGNLPGEAVRADYTITFGLPKGGNLLYPGYKYQGRLYWSPISMPRELSHSTQEKHNNDSIYTTTFPELPEIPVDAYKGSRGHGLIIGGSPQYTGAPGFAGAGAMASGLGYVHLASLESVCRDVAQREPELVFHPLVQARNLGEFTEEKNNSSDSFIGLEHLDQIKELLPGKSTVILGPGIGLNPQTGQLIERLIPHIQTPLIIDGDALTHMSTRLELLKDHSGPIILTPHVGEAARLLQWDSKKVQQDAVYTARCLAQISKSIIIYKQPHSLLALPNGEVYINLSGSPALATAGSGDLLCGVLAAMIGLFPHLKDASMAAMMIHGLAGELLEEKRGALGARAGDLLNILPETLEYYRNNRKSILGNFNRRLLPL